jgi:hypothetical protein
VRNFAGIPAIQVTFMGALHGPIPARFLGQEPQGTTKKLCLCDLQRKKDEERRQKKKSEPEGRNQ